MQMQASQDYQLVFKMGDHLDLSLHHDDTDKNGVTRVGHLQSIPVVQSDGV